MRVRLLEDVVDERGRQETDELVCATIFPLSSFPPPPPPPPRPFPVPVPVVKQKKTLEF